MAEVEARFPPKLKFLFQPARYKCAYGGRGSGKSWGVARALLILAAERKMRILCTREVQRSIRDSVHKLLSDQIEALGLSGFYKILEASIQGANGSEFMFAGLSTQTIESIKSFEGIDVCWAEEAQKITRKSWTILIPTIRKDGSEIWITFNPELDDDETYQRFVVNAPPNSQIIKINYHDNPWFPAVLEAERAHAKRTLSADEYANIWEGDCRAAVEGAIFAGEMRAAIEQGRICNVPYDSKLKVHSVWDLGWNDKTSIILAQRHLSEIRVIEYIEDSHRTLDWYSAELRNKHYNWGKMFLPHDGSHKTLQTGRSAAEVMRDLKWSVSIVPNVPVEVGIKQARMAFAKTYFDKGGADRLLQCLKRYRRNIPVSTEEPSTPVHDEYSHGADAFRYLALSAPSMANEEHQPIKYPKSSVI